MVDSTTLVKAREWRVDRVDEEYGIIMGISGGVWVDSAPTLSELDGDDAGWAYDDLEGDF